MYSDAGHFTRLYPADEVKPAAMKLMEFLEANDGEAWEHCAFHFGGFKQTWGNQDPLITLECHETSWIERLRRFVIRNKDILKPRALGRAYINAPLTNDREWYRAFYPHYPTLRKT